MGIVKRILVPLTVILVIGTVIFVAVYFSTRGGTSKNLGKYIPRPLESYNWCGNRKVVALTFDDGPEPSTTPTLLADLKRHGVKATFFMSPAVNGQPNNQHCALVKDVLKDGHSVQSHSWDHSNYVDKDGAGMQSNLETNHQWLKKCADGKKLSLSQFRPPFGSLDVARAKFTSDLGYTLATWNIESLDYTGATAQQAFTNIQTGFANVPAGGSAVIIMHDKHYHQGGTLGLVDLLVPFFKDKGYKFVTGPECYDKCNNLAGGVCKAPFQVWPGTYDQIY